MKPIVLLLAIIFFTHWFFLPLKKQKLVGSLEVSIPSGEIRPFWNLLNRGQTILSWRSKKDPFGALQLSFVQSLFYRFTKAFSADNIPFSSFLQNLHQVITCSYKVIQDFMLVKVHG